MTAPAPFQKIVVPLDGSKWAEKAIPHAEQIARSGDGELILLHIYKPAGHEYLSDASLARQDAHLDQARQNAENYVKGLRSEITSQNIRVSAHVVEGSEMADLICDFVNAEGADVIVMTATSHNRVVRVLIGDVTNRIAECCTACLLLVRGNLEAQWKRDGGRVEAVGAETPTPRAAALNPSPEAVRLLEQLASLHEAGILSDAEFSTKRADVMRRG
jgi:nucleotide-binding universal stress UspA family protein